MKKPPQLSLIIPTSVILHVTCTSESSQVGATNVPRLWIFPWLWPCVHILCFPNLFVQLQLSKATQNQLFCKSCMTIHTRGRKTLRTSVVWLCASLGLPACNFLLKGLLSIQAISSIRIPISFLAAKTSRCSVQREVRSFLVKFLLGTGHPHTNFWRSKIKIKKHTHTHAHNYYEKIECCVHYVPNVIIRHRQCLMLPYRARIY